MRASKARFGHSAENACHRRWSAYGKSAVTHPRWEPCAGILHARIWAGAVSNDRPYRTSFRVFLSLTQSGPCTVRKLIRSFRCFPGPRVRRPFPYSPRLRNASGASASISQYPNAANVPSINGLLGLRYRPHQIECESGRLDASGCPSPNTWRWPLIVSMYSRTRAMRPSRHSKMKQ